MGRKKIQHNQMVSELKKKGITFNHISESEAEDFLRNSNYFYKLTAYRKKFSKSQNKYEDLDFSFLVDLSSIDMRLRYHIMKMALDIEHSIKTLLLKSITDNPHEDGYKIVDEFKRFDPGNYGRTVRIFKSSEYLSDMYNKRGHDIPVWVFVEIMDYGTLSKFVAFYRSKYKAIDLKAAHDLLPYSKHLRNSAAHSNILLINIYGDKNLLRDNSGNVRTPSSEIVSYANYYNIDKDDVRFNKLHDLVALFTLHRKYTSTVIHSNRTREFDEILKRIDRNKEYYSNNTNLQRFFSTLRKLNS